MNEFAINIREKLKKKLDERRYEHTLGVAYTAACLAMRYGVDLKQAELAGLLHDCAKCMSDTDKVLKCRKHHIPVTAAERKNPSLLHAKLGAYYAKSKYGVEDEEIISAIACHTTGKPAMTTLEEILFIADYIEPDRDKAPDLAVIRSLAFQDLKLAVAKVLEGTIQYVKKKEDVMDETTLQAYRYYAHLLETDTTAPDAELLQ